jgi:hypothetical protein
MNSTRRFSAVAGIVFIVTTVAGVVCLGILGSLLDGPDFVRRVAASPDRLALAAVFEALMGIGCAGIALALYPVLRHANPGLAIGAVGLRVVEGALLLVVAGCWAALATFAGDASSAGSLDAASTRASADLLRSLANQCGTLGNIPFCAGAGLYYLVFWQSRLAPRWLSGWGLLAAVPYLAAGLYALLSRTEVRDLTVLMMPMAVQEMVFAVWLIAKGVRKPGEIPAATAAGGGPVSAAASVEPKSAASAA